MRVEIDCIDWLVNHAAHAVSFETIFASSPNNCFQKLLVCWHWDNLLMLQGDLLLSVQSGIPLQAGCLLRLVCNWSFHRRLLIVHHVRPKEVKDLAWYWQRCLLGCYRHCRPLLRRRRQTNDGKRRGSHLHLRCRFSDLRPWQDWPALKSLAQRRR